MHEEPWRDREDARATGQRAESEPEGSRTLERPDGASAPFCGARGHKAQARKCEWRSHPGATDRFAIAPGASRIIRVTGECGAGHEVWNCSDDRHTGRGRGLGRWGRGGCGRVLFSLDECVERMVREFSCYGWAGIEIAREGDGSRGSSAILRVRRVYPDSPASEAGLREGDVIVAVNGIEVAGFDGAATKRLREHKRAGATFLYVVRRGQRILRVPVRLAAIPKDALAAWIGRHILEEHVEHRSEGKCEQVVPVSN